MGGRPSRLEGRARKGSCDWFSGGDGAGKGVQYDLGCSSMRPNVHKRVRALAASSLQGVTSATYSSAEIESASQYCNHRPDARGSTSQQSRLEVADCSNPSARSRLAASPVLSACDHCALAPPEPSVGRLFRRVSDRRTSACGTRSV